MIPRSLGGEGNRIGRSFGEEGNKNARRCKGKGIELQKIGMLRKMFSIKSQYKSSKIFPLDNVICCSSVVLVWSVCVVSAQHVQFEDYLSVFGATKA